MLVLFALKRDDGRGRKERGAALPLTAHRRGLRLCRGAASGAAAEERKKGRGCGGEEEEEGVDNEGGVPNGPDPRDRFNSANVWSV